MWQCQCPDIISLCMHIIKEQLRRQQLSYHDIKGEFQKELERKLNVLESWQAQYEHSPIGIKPLTPKEQLLNQNKKVKNNIDNIAFGSTKDKPIALISMVLMTCDYYENNYLGKKMADQNHAQHNDKIDAIRLDQIRTLANDLIKLYLNPNIEINIRQILNKIKETIDAILSEWKIWIGVSDSRLAGTLIKIYNNFSNKNNKYNPQNNPDMLSLPDEFRHWLSDEWPDFFDKSSDLMHKNLPSQIFDDLNFKSSNDSKRYLQQHITNQVYQKFVIQYKKEVSSRSTVYTDPQKIMAVENIGHELNELIEPTAPILEPKDIIPAIRNIFAKHTQICGNVEPIFKKGQFGECYKNSEFYLSNFIETDLIKIEIPNKSNDENNIIQSISKIFTKYSNGLNLAFYPTPWRNLPAVKIKKELNRLYHMSQNELSSEIANRGFETLNQLLLNMLSNIDISSEIDPEKFKSALQQSKNILNNSHNNDRKIENNDNKQPNFSSEVLIVNVLKICDYYCNTQLGKESTAEQNEKTYFAGHIQRLTRTLLKYSANEPIDIAVALKHIQNTIEEIRDTPWRGTDSRLAQKLTQLHNDFCVNLSYKKLPFVLTKPSLPIELSYNDDKKSCAVYKRRGWPFLK